MIHTTRAFHGDVHTSADYCDGDDAMRLLGSFAVLVKPNDMYTENE